MGKNRLMGNTPLPALPGQRASGRTGRKLSSRWQGWLWGYFFVGPSLLFFLVFSAYPIIATILVSFQQIHVVHGGSWVGLSNYQACVQDRVLFQVLRNSIVYVLGIVPIGTILTLFLSVLIFQLNDRLGTAFKAAYYLPRVVAGAILAIVWAYIFNPAFGVLNFILQSIGLPPVLWLARPTTAIWSLIAMYHVTRWGSSVVLVCAALGSIPVALYEAATIDGASRFRQFLDITLPLLKPVLTYVMIIATISSLAIFQEIYVLTNGGPGYSTANLVFYFYVTAFQNFNFGVGSAQAMLLLILTIILAIVQYRYLATDVQY